MCVSSFPISMKLKSFANSSSISLPSISLPCFEQLTSSSLLLHVLRAQLFSICITLFDVVRLFLGYSELFLQGTHSQVKEACVNQCVFTPWDGGEHPMLTGCIHSGSFTI